MKGSQIAVRYAKSVMNLAEEFNRVEQVKEDMELFMAAVKEIRDLRLLVESPIVKHLDKLVVLEKVFTNKVSELSMKFFEVITRHARENILPLIAQEVINLYNLKKGIQVAEITTAVALDDSLRQTIKNVVKQATGMQEVLLTEKIDTELIGGYVLKAGDQQIDTSVQRALTKLKRTLKD